MQVWPIFLHAQFLEINNENTQSYAVYGKFLPFNHRVCFTVFAVAFIAKITICAFCALLDRTSLFCAKIFLGMHHTASKDWNIFRSSRYFCQQTSIVQKPYLSI